MQIEGLRRPSLKPNQIQFMSGSQFPGPDHDSLIRSFNHKTDDHSKKTDPLVWQAIILGAVLGGGLLAAYGLTHFVDPNWLFGR